MSIADAAVSWGNVDMVRTVGECCIGEQLFRHSICMSIYGRWIRLSRNKLPLFSLSRCENM